MNDAPAQHTINALAVGVPVISFWVRAPEIVTVVAGCLGIIWYTILILEKINHWLQKDRNDPLDYDDGE